MLAVETGTMHAMSDREYMTYALQLARRGLFTTDPNPRVGCVIVRDDQVVGTGWHQYAGGPHAEINALNQAADRAQGATAYVTLEPCCHFGKTPPCTDALVAAGVSRVVAAMPDPNPLVAGKGLQQLQQAGIDIELGLLQAQAEALNPGCLMRVRAHRPYIRCKMAMSLDGRVAMASGESKWITSVEARRDVQHYRARSSAILTGVGTVLADDPILNVRIDELRPNQEQAHHAPGVDDIRQPLRVIVDSHRRTPGHSRVLTTTGKTLLVSTLQAPDSSNESLDESLQGSVAFVAMPEKDGRVDLKALMHYLAKQKINEVLVEAGPTLSGALIQAGLIDELIIYMAPHLMGDDARGLFRLPGLTGMKHCIELDVLDIRSVGKDFRITAQLGPRDVPES